MSAPRPILLVQDVVERFHLLITLSFVAVEEMASSGHAAPNRTILVQVPAGAEGSAFFGMGVLGFSWQEGCCSGSWVRMKAAGGTPRWVL